MKSYWQIAAGADGRDYSEDFLKYGMAFVGGAEQKKKMRNEVLLNDIVILKRGVSEIVAVGKVVERNGKFKGEDDTDKDWLKDYDGWELTGYCFVDWHIPNETIKTSGLTMGTIYRTHLDHLIQIAEKTLDQFPPKNDYGCMPEQTEVVKIDEILEFAVHEGLRPALADDLLVAIKRIQLLAKYYYDGWWKYDVGEHETRTFLIVPFLLALGWSEQQIKIELGIESRQRVDVACFSKPYRKNMQGEPNNDDCTLLLESKDFRSGLDYAPEQVKNYAQYFPKCKVIVVSNGFCYKSYEKKSEGFDTIPSAYLNLLRPRKKYPLDPSKVKGALEVLKHLMPKY